MPAFTFEKIAPPRGPGPTGPSDDAIPNAPPAKQRGVIVQVLGRFVEARVMRTHKTSADTDDRSKA